MRRKNEPVDDAVRGGLVIWAEVGDVTVGLSPGVGYKGGDRISLGLGVVFGNSIALAVDSLGCRLMSRGGRRGLLAS